MVPRREQWKEPLQLLCVGCCYLTIRSRNHDSYSPDFCICTWHVQKKKIEGTEYKKRRKKRKKLNKYPAGRRSFCSRCKFFLSSFKQVMVRPSSFTAVYASKHFELKISFASVFVKSSDPTCRQQRDVAWLCC